MKKFLILTFLPLLILSCTSLNKAIKKKPEVSLKRFDIDSISLKDVTFVFEIELNNPYPVGFRLEDVGFNVKIDENRLFNTRTKKGVKVAAGGREITPINVTLVYRDIMRIIKNYSQRDYLNCVIDIDIVIPLPESIQAIKKNIVFNYTVQKKIPALQPSFKIVNVSVTAPSMNDIKRSIADAGRKNLDPDKIYSMFEGMISGRKAAPAVDLTSLDVPITMNFDVEVKNNTKAELKCRDLAYDFYINNSKILGGSTSDVINEESRFVIRIKNIFSSKALGGSVTKMFDSRSGAYQLKGYSNIKLPDEIKPGPLRLDFDENGTFILK